MKTPPHRAGKKKSPSEEITGLESALAKAYTRLRERARMAWERQHAGKKEPSDASVSVRITATSKAPPALPARKTAPLLAAKTKKPRRKIPPAKGRGRK
ncbi:MAG TPA: hypothetical protein VGF73_09485 [Chthoniobacterales bacterium]|jgi:hypothetical protein